MVQVELNSSSTPGFLIEEKEDEGEEPAHRAFKLVHVGDKFVYLRRPEYSCACPTDAKAATVQPFQYAVPVVAIATMTYVE